MFFKDVLPNGLRVITEEMPSVYSVSASIWVGTGSAYEKPEFAGVSHFLEHMMFKGTEKRTYTEISELMESVGGQMNAFTSREHTCYYVRCLAENFDLGMDLLSDMYLNSVFAEEEYQKEKGVILEEINMYEDAPDDLVGDLFNSVIMPSHPYGKPIIGTVDSVKGLTRDAIHHYYKEVYSPGETVVVVAGNVKRQEVLAEVEKYLGSHQGAWRRPLLSVPEYAAGSGYIFKDIEQVHVIMGVPALKGNDPDIYKLQILSNILGGGVSSRLFQEVREKRGLTYSVYSSNGALSHGGIFYAYASTSPKNVEELLKVMGEEMAKIAAYGVSEAELARSQAQIKGSLLMGSESSSNIMVRLGKGETNYGEAMEVETLVKEIMAVTAAEVQAMAQQLLTPDKLALAQVGAKEHKVDVAKLLQCS